MIRVDHSAQYNRKRIWCNPNLETQYYSNATQNENLGFLDDDEKRVLNL